jgi:carbonic anhydrase
MSVIDKAFEADHNYAKAYNPTLGNHPAPKIAVVTCMDPRLSYLPGILGLPPADLDVIRTGGPAVTEDVLAELIVSNRILGTKEILLLNHTRCGLTTFTDDELSASTGDAVASPHTFLLLQRHRAAHAGTNRQGKITSLDCERSSGLPEP